MRRAVNALVVQHHPFHRAKRIQAERDLRDIVDSRVALLTE
jgi:hypothetical protein